MGEWSLRKASSKLCRMKKQGRDQAAENQTGLETDMKHTLTATFSPVPAHCVPWLSLRTECDRFQCLTEARKEEAFCVICIWYPCAQSFHYRKLWGPQGLGCLSKKDERVPRELTEAEGSGYQPCSTHLAALILLCKRRKALRTAPAWCLVTPSQTWLCIRAI